jgi:hypothetical protein
MVDTHSTPFTAQFSIARDQSKRSIRAWCESITMTLWRLLLVGASDAIVWWDVDTFNEQLPEIFDLARPISNSHAQVTEKKEAS